MAALRCLQIVRYEQLIDEGKEAIQAHMPPKPDDIATICYTSGTTGVPKVKDGAESPPPSFQALIQRGTGPCVHPRLMHY